MARTLHLPDVTGLEVAVDTESSGLYVDDFARGSKYRCSLAVVSLAWVLPSGDIHAVALPFDQERFSEKQDGGDRPMLFDMEEGGEDPNLDWDDWVYLLEWLSFQRHIGQKYKHDLHFLRAGTRMWPGRDLEHAVWWDTLLASRLLEPREKASLDAIGERHLGTGKYKVELEGVIRGSKGRYGTPTHPRYDLVPWRIMEPYARQDAMLTLRAKLWQAERFESEPELLEHFRHEMALLPIIYRMERAGVQFDKAASYAAATECERRMEVLEVDLEFKPTPEKASAWFFGKMGAVPHCMTVGSKEKKPGDRGYVAPRPSMLECCVRSLTMQPKVAEQAKRYQRWSKLDSAVSKYYLGWAEALGADGLLRTDLDQAGTISQRFSSRRINLQAVPNDFRHAEFVEGLVLPRYLLFPEDQMQAAGLVAIEFDLEQAELRMATSYAGCKLMRELLETGADVHSETADMLFGERGHQARQMAKRCNFALLYSVGPLTFRDDVERQTGVILSLEESKGVISKWRGIYPEFQAINHRATRLAEQRGYVQLWDGRLRWFSDRELQFESSKAFNQVIQGGIAQIVKRWMVAVDRDLPGMLRLQIHDSLVCAVPRESQMAVCAAIKRSGEGIATAAAEIPMIVGSKPWQKS